MIKEGTGRKVTEKAQYKVFRPPHITVDQSRSEVMVDFVQNKCMMLFTNSVSSFSSLPSVISY